MTLAIFGISNSGLNLVVTLFILMLVVVWLALIVFTYLDARRRISDPFLVACATVASFFPYIGTAVYAILRPPEFLEDAHERELEIRAAELRVRQLEQSPARNCEYPIERSYLRCPNCQRRLKDPCRELRQAGRPALGALPLLRDRASRGRAQRSHDANARSSAARRQTPALAPRSSAAERAAAAAKSPRAGAERRGRPTQTTTQRSPEP